MIIIVKINERQETFCQELINGKSQRQAYYIAFTSSKKWKAETVDSKASTLAKSGKIKERMAELRATTAEQNEISRNDLLAHLKTIGFANIDFKKIRPTDKIKAIEIMVKILGFDKQDENSKEAIEIILRRD